MKSGGGGAAGPAPGPAPLEDGAASCRAAADAVSDSARAGVREVQGAAVVAVGEEKAHHLRREAGQNVLDGEEILQGLGHLLPVDGEEAVVQPELGEGLAGGRFGLGQLVFVVGEDQVLAAAVEVEGLPQVMHAHGGALDVPARTAGPPGGCPRRVPPVCCPSRGRNPGGLPCWGPPRCGPRPPGLPVCWPESLP